jgi:type VI secretion system protein ImpK
MRKEIAELVHPVILCGLRLKERLERGETPDLDAEQATLKDLLLTEYEARRWIDYGGNAPSRAGEPSPTPAADARQSFADSFLGIRYALVCWLDELFTCDPNWGPRWNERKLEVELYGTNDRAWKFWEQERLAQARTGNDAFEVFFLCVMLGFRGEMRDKPEKLQAWAANSRHRLGKVQEQDWPFSTELEPPTHVPPLRGRDRLRRMIAVGWITLLLMIPVMSFLIVHRMGQ